ncbi:MAG TPA: ABC transporter ATP-binding protein [Synergistales bacterium]|jgi:branched-chain amino acid transport system ATP-binding protein|nr:ABC transporter ATP-binding protein [Synergistaceae bacterium]MDD3916008.1 ABC transporter ATP-binding protein [Synergistaceae bacterium]HOO88718.1 ABC transporter ATP-binding protein [Synergistales bacterium]HPE64569.1 ABC transporter ATP-binding protein [Synergistales bacterium]HRV98199.1 ABC transporter ATP-binding protein [Aminobacteriaceae bacterium]
MSDAVMNEKKALLEVHDLHVSYGAIKALSGVSLKVFEGEIVSVIGSNGAGKSTLMNAIMGMVRREKGEILLGDVKLDSRSFRVVQQGISLSPEGRKVFAPLTVLENLKMGAFPRGNDSKVEEDYEWVFSLFPRLKERISQYAGTLSGGEQQMLAIGRALMSRPKVLLLDEPSLGLAPIIIKDIFKELRRINNEGVTILLVEQNARQALLLSNRGYVIQTGRLVTEGPSEELLANADIKAAYLGGGHAKGKTTQALA